jgi:hypothetical protein
MTELQMSARERIDELGTSTLSAVIQAGTPLWEARAKFGYHPLQTTQARRANGNAGVRRP